MKKVFKVFKKVFIKKGPTCTICGGSNTYVLEATDTNFCGDCNKSF